MWKKNMTCDFLKVKLMKISLKGNGKIKRPECEKRIWSMIS